MKTVAVIPAFNESSRISAVISGAKTHVDEVIVVDDGSRDGTYQTVATRTDCLPVRHRMNLGKGSALKTGCDLAIQRGATTIVVLDADGQHLPEEIPALLAPIASGADLVFGIRTIRSDKPMPLLAKVGNVGITVLTRILFGIRVTDTQSGFRAFTARAYQSIRWQSTNYAVETEMIVRAGKHHLKTAEVPITTVYHDRYKGTTVFDGVRIVLNMLLWRIKP